MTTGTGADDLTVINTAGRHRRPCTRKFVMTSVAQVRCAWVPKPLSTPINPIVTVNTVTRKAGMIHGGETPRRGIVAGITLVCRWNMIKRFIAAVASAAGTAYLGMIHLQHRHETDSAMTKLAFITGGDMADRLAKGSDIVVTSDTTPQHFIVVYSQHGNERAGAMAAITFIC